MNIIICLHTFYVCMFKISYLKFYYIYYMFNQQNDKNLILIYLFIINSCQTYNQFKFHY
jgi:hypothetical protein